MQGQILTLEEVAACLRTHRTTIYRLVKRGKLRGFKVGSDYRFFSEEIEKFTNPNGVIKDGQ